MPSLRELRLRAGLTQAELAHRAGIRQATISAIENRRTHPHRSTLVSIARALDLRLESIQAAVRQPLPPREGGADPVSGMTGDWAFLDGLDRDLRSGLARSLVAEWTHSSTAIEGNTISAGDTLFVITEGLTVGGKSLREHQEIHGHVQAIGLLVAWTRARDPVRVAQLHELHRAIQTGVAIDAFAPVGRFKVEQNGTTALTTRGTTAWHEYARPDHVPVLVDQWLRDLATASREAASVSGADVHGARDLLHRVYTDAHLGFAGIHPYADGNGRMARLLANVPLLRTGQPPLLVSAAARREYMALLGDYSLSRGQPQPGEPLVSVGSERDALEAFFGVQWEATRKLVATYRERQAARNCAPGAGSPSDSRFPAD